MKNHPLKGNNSIYFNAMETGFNSETVLSFDISHRASITTGNFSGGAAAAKKEKELNEVGA